MYWNIYSFHCLQASLSVHTRSSALFYNTYNSKVMIHFLWWKGVWSRKGRLRSARWLGLIVPVITKRDSRNIHSMGGKEKHKSISLWNLCIFRINGFNRRIQFSNYSLHIYRYCYGFIASPELSLWPIYSFTCLLYWRATVCCLLCT